MLVLGGPSFGRRLGAGRLLASRHADDGSGSVAVGREVHAVDRAMPRPAPGPADRGERPGHDVAGLDHAGPDVGAVEVGAGQFGQHPGAAGVGVLERVEVDGEAAGVRRPVGAATDVPADERGGVVAVAGRPARSGRRR